MYLATIYASYLAWMLKVEGQRRRTDNGQRQSELQTRDVAMSTNEGEGNHRAAGVLDQNRQALSGHEGSDDPTAQRGNAI